jgi:hypothetical protein
MKDLASLEGPPKWVPRSMSLIVNANATRSFRKFFIPADLIRRIRLKSVYLNINFRDEYKSCENWESIS